MEAQRKGVRIIRRQPRSWVQHLNMTGLKDEYYGGIRRFSVKSMRATWKPNRMSTKYKLRYVWWQVENEGVIKESSRQMNKKIAHKSKIEATNLKEECLKFVEDKPYKMAQLFECTKVFNEGGR